MEVPDWLVYRNGQLYCSLDCVERFNSNGKYLPCRPVYKAEYDKNHDDNVESGAHWGALCECGKEYNSF